MAFGRGAIRGGNYNGCPLRPSTMTIRQTFGSGRLMIEISYYKSGHAVPSVNVGYEYENKISKNKTAFTFEFRGLKNK